MTPTRAHESDQLGAQWNPPASIHFIPGSRDNGRELSGVIDVTLKAPTFQNQHLGQWIRRVKAKHSTLQAVNSLDTAFAKGAPEVVDSKQLQPVLTHTIRLGPKSAFKRGARVWIHVRIKVSDASGTLLQYPAFVICSTFVELPQVEEDCDYLEWHLAESSQSKARPADTKRVTPNVIRLEVDND